MKKIQTATAAQISAITCLVKRKRKKNNLMLKILNETVNLTDVLGISVHSGGGNMTLNLIHSRVSLLGNKQSRTRRHF